MKRLQIDWHDLEAAFDCPSDAFGMEFTNYFDLESGEVILVDDQTRSAADAIIDELGESADWSEDVIRATDTFQQLHDVEQRSVLTAIMIDCGDSQQFEQIPQFDSHEAYESMRNFIEMISDDTTRGQLSDAIAQRKPFFRFRDVVAGDRRLEQQWRAFETARQRETMIAWLHGIGVEPANPEGAKYEPSPLPDLRRIMFAEVLRFVRSARDMDGVRRIALIGSLSTEKEFPKDIDLLVTVSADCDLQPLARLGRQISGHMNSHQAGADVFLANQDGEYIGRTCPWKRCGPGYRTTCDALHCGERPYLHDDFNAIRLRKELIVQPPVRLWPNPAAAESVPRDVREQLIEPLVKDERR